MTVMILATRTGWTVDYIKTLTPDQLNLFMDALGQINYNDLEKDAALAGAKLKTQRPVREYGVKDFKEQTKEDKVLINEWVKAQGVSRHGS